MGRGGGKDEEVAGGMAAKRNRASALRCCALRTLLALSQATMAASFVSVALVLSLRLSPSPWGWAFISFSLLSLLSASLGYFSFSLSLSLASPSSSTPPPFYRLYSFLSALSICVTGSSFILLLSNPSAVLTRLRSSRSDFDARILLRVDATFLIAVFCFQMVVLLSSCVLSHSSPTRRGYHDLEGKKLSGRVQELTEKEEEEEEKKEKEEDPSMAIAKVAEVVSNVAKDEPNTANSTTAASTSTVAKEQEKRKVEEKAAFSLPQIHLHIV